jgi:RHS repeat-associated protein
MNHPNPIATTSKTPYPFGMHMPGRSFSSGSYRYGFNGMESDDEIKGDGNSLDFGARIYDSRLGRWLSVDPYATKYVGIGPYTFVDNKPIWAVDSKGKDIFFIINDNNEGNVALKKENFITILNILGSTANGKELIDKYINNPDEHIYFTIDVISTKENTSSLANTYLFKGQMISMANVNGKFKNTKEDLTPDLSLFNDIPIDEDAEKNAFVILDNNLFGQEEFGFGKEAKLGAKTIAHEEGAHIDELGHEEWGQEYYTTENEFGDVRSPAWFINALINNLNQEDYKENYELKNVENQENVYKVSETDEEK